MYKKYDTTISEAVEVEMIAFIGCAGCGAGKERFAGCASCKEAVESGFKKSECKDGCVGVGSCIKSCKNNAMSLVDGKVVVDPEKCDGCGDCAAPDVCPQGLIRMIPKEATNFIPCSSTEEDDDIVKKICGYGCISCGECERACPQGAISIVNNHAVIDYDKCVGCVACAVKCRKKIIVDTLHNIAELKEKVAFVKCSADGRAAETYRAMGITTCTEAAKLSPKDYNLCTTGCLGLGKCTSVCRYGAITVENGCAVVDYTKCVGCKDCTAACPMGLISIVPYRGIKQVPCSSLNDYAEKAAVCSSGCIACGDCQANCPNEAIFMEDKHAAINSDYCEDCKVCTYMCARNVIKAQEVPDYIFQQRVALGLEEGE